MRVVIALGGNALLRRGEPTDIDTQRANARVAARALAPLMDEHQVVVTHGNGPQVGLLALRDDAAGEGLDVLGAQTDGMIGYLLMQEIANASASRSVVAVLTQTLVAHDDAAHAIPTKPIGPVYDEPTAQALATQRGWTIGPDGPNWRRLVRSPEPLDILEIPAVNHLLDVGFLVVCAGGGGIPVTQGPEGLQGADVVVDKDLTTALLAARLSADALLLLTDVEAIYENFGTDDQKPVRTVTPQQVRSLRLPAGSMRPKAEAAARFVEQTGGFAAIGALGDVARLMRGDGGTRVIGVPR